MDKQPFHPSSQVGKQRPRAAKSLIIKDIRDQGDSQAMSFLLIKPVLPREELGRPLVAKCHITSRKKRSRKEGERLAGKISQGLRMSLVRLRATSPT